MIRIDTETTGMAFGPLDAARASSSGIPESKLPLAGTPIDDLWAIKAATDMVGVVLCASQLTSGGGSTRRHATRPPCSGSTPGREYQARQQGHEGELDEQARIRYIGMARCSSCLMGHDG